VVAHDKCVVADSGGDIRSKTTAQGPIHHVFLWIRPLLSKRFVGQSCGNFACVGVVHIRQQQQTTEFFKFKFFTSLSTNPVTRKYNGFMP
jgi:hypothetical protein